MNNYYIYFHKNPKNNQIFYIGLGSHVLYQKYKRAYCFKQRNNFWKNYTNKHGGPVVEIIHDNLTQEAACVLEKEYILKYGRRKYEINGILVNESLGGQGGKQGIKVSEETKLKQSQKLRGKPKPQGFGEKIRNNRNHKLAGELSKQSNLKHYKIGSERNIKISQKLKGRKSPIPHTTGKLIGQYNLNMTEINRYPSIRQAGILNNYKTSESIRKCCKGEQKTAYGYIWKYLLL